MTEARVRRAYLPGTEVRMTQGGVAGIVVKTSLSSEGVEYNVAWWVGGERKDAWVGACELEADERLGHIGFGRVEE